MFFLKLILKTVVLIAFVFGWLVLFQHGTDDFEENAKKEFAWIQATLPFLKNGAIFEGSGKNSSEESPD